MLEGLRARMPGMGYRGADVGGGVGRSSSKDGLEEGRS